MWKRSSGPASAVIVAVALTTPGWALTITDVLPGTFVDISVGGVGTPLGLDLDQVVEIVTTIGNPVFPAGAVAVGNNGGIGFQAGTNELILTDVNEPIPSDDAFGGDQALLAFWDDIGNEVGDIYWTELVMPASANRPAGEALIVQWEEKRFDQLGPGPDDTATFQIQVFQDPGPDDIFAQLLYTDIEQERPGGGKSATIGYQDGAAGFNDFQWSFDTEGAVSNGTVLSLIPEPMTGLLLVAGAALLRRRGRMV